MPTKAESPWAAVDALLAADREPTGPEWFTKAQFEQRYGVSKYVAKRKLAALVKSGNLEQWFGKRMGLSGGFAKYRVKPKPPRAK
jgi:hypothetical protein